MMLTITRCTDPAPLRAFLNGDALETAYALGDLDPALWDEAEFWGAFGAEAALKGVVLFYHGFSIPTLTLHGEPSALRAILEQAPLPPEVFCLAPSTCREVVAAHYVTQHIYDLMRMAITPSQFTPPARTLPAGYRLRRLWADDAASLNKLYQGAADPHEEILAFSPTQIAQGFFFGVETNAGRLVAAAGTHIASTRENIGAVGNVFTDPDQRGLGLGALTSAAVTQALFDAGITRVVLNVKAGNEAAIKVYTRLGYQAHLPFIEGPAKLK